MWGLLKNLADLSKSFFGGAKPYSNIPSDFSEESLVSQSKTDGILRDVCSRRSFLLKLSLLSGLLLSAQSAGALTVKGVSYTSLADLAKRFGMSVKTLRARKAQKLYNKYVSLNFEVHRRDMTLNNNKIWLGFPVVEYKGLLYVANADVSDTLVPILYPRGGKYMPRLRTIVIDPGHGGKDNGAISKPYRLYEKNLTLDISLKLAKVLRAKGYKVYLTRYGDKFIELQNRPAYANKIKADMFVSIHINAASPSASGIETYALTPVGQSSTNAAGSAAANKRKYSGNANDDWNVLLAHYIQKDMVAKLSGLDRGTKRARFAVLQSAAMPAVLVECGFISNNADVRKLSSDKYRQKIATAIASGISRYASTLARLRK